MSPVRKRSSSGPAVLVGLVLVMGAAGDQRAQAREDDEARCGEIPRLPPATTDWPRIRSEIRRDPFTEAIIAGMVSRMTLPEKVGQMTQAEIQSITPAEVRQYHIGSVLNGGGSWPNSDKHATPSAWLAFADAYWDAALAANGQVKIPIMWGIDAVHGNSNVFGATLFPHNIGLGAAHDPCLVRRIGPRHRPGLGIRAHAGGRARRSVGPDVRGVLRGSRHHPRVRRGLCGRAPERGRGRG